MYLFKLIGRTVSRFSLVIRNMYGCWQELYRRERSNEMFVTLTTAPYVRYHAVYKYISYYSRLFLFTIYNKLTEVIVYFINSTEINKQNIFEIGIKVSKLWYFQIICRVVGFVGMYTAV